MRRQRTRPSRARSGPGRGRVGAGLNPTGRLCHLLRRELPWAAGTSADGPQIELEENIVVSQLSQLDEQLQAALPALGYSFEGFKAESDKRGDNVVALTQKPAAE